MLFPEVSLIFILIVCHFAFTIHLLVYSFSHSSSSLFLERKVEMTSFGYSGKDKKLTSWMCWRRSGWVVSDFKK